MPEPVRSALVLAAMLALLAGCGGGGGGGGAAAVNSSQLIAVLEFDVSGGTMGHHTVVFVNVGAHTADSQSTGINAWPMPSLNKHDDGSVVVAEPTGLYYETLAALTDGQVSDVGVRVTVGSAGNGGSGFAVKENSTGFQILDPTPGVVDLQGFYIDAIHLHAEEVTVDSPSVLWTDYAVRGRVLIFGHRP